MEEKNQNDERRGELATYAKSNRIINAKGRSSSLGLKLFAIGISNVHPTKNGGLEAVIKGQELRKVFNNQSGSFYQAIKDIIHPKDEYTPSILDWRVYMSNDEEESTTGINIIPDATFRNGELRLTFNSKIKDDIYKLSSNYTILSIAQMINLESPYSIRMYEMFQSEMDLQQSRYRKYGPKEKINGPYYVSYEIDELKQILGISTPGDPAKTKGKNGKKKTGYTAKGDLYERYTDFRRKVILRVQQELNENTSIHMEFEAKRSGRGGKVTGILFTLTRVDRSKGKDDGEVILDEAPAVTSENAALTLGRAVVLLAGQISSVDDIRAICDAADNDYDRIERAVQLSKKQKEIRNLTGWLIRAVREDYAADNAAEQNASASTEQGKSESGTGEKRRGSAGATSAGKSGRNSFRTREEHDYDFDDLEEKLLKS